jgi:hypothetical protein
MKFPLPINYYCGSGLSGHFAKSGFVRLDLIGSKSPLEGTRELKIEAKFAGDTGELHKKITAKNLNKKVFLYFWYFRNFKLKNLSKRTKW